MNMQKSDIRLISETYNLRQIQGRKDNKMCSKINKKMFRNKSKTNNQENWTILETISITWHQFVVLPKDNSFNILHTTSGATLYYGVN